MIAVELMAECGPIGSLIVDPEEPSLVDVCFDPVDTVRKRHSDCKR